MLKPDVRRPETQRRAEPRTGLAAGERALGSCERSDADDSSMLARVVFLKLHTKMQVKRLVLLLSPVTWVVRPYSETQAQRLFSSAQRTRTADNRQGSRVIQHLTGYPQTICCRDGRPLRCIRIVTAEKMQVLSSALVLVCHLAVSGLRSQIAPARRHGPISVRTSRRTAESVYRGLVRARQGLPDDRAGWRSLLV